jgi:hypothetical protein
MSRKSVLLIGGSLNQTTMMAKIAARLEGHDCFFSPLYADGLLGWAARRDLLGFTTLGGEARRRSLCFLGEQGLPVDDGGGRRPYDLVVTGTDLIVPGNVRGRRLVLIQEGMTDPEDYRYHLVRSLRLPRYLANTSMTGLSDAYDRFCVASEGYRDLFVRKGARPEKLVVTGMPNFDDCARFLDNDFPRRGYVLAATSWLRETLKCEDRPAFIRKALGVADGRLLLFKLHPHENKARAMREIEHLAPQALVFPDGNTDHMIANCDALVTRYSSVVWVAQALGKEIHCDLDRETLERLAPLQNGGDSARRIAAVCRELLE